MKRVLLVEDEPLVAEATADLLLDGGHQVVTASTYEEAIEALEGCGLDMMVADIGIPGAQDGLALAEAAAARWPALNIVIVSGNERPEGGRCPQRAVFFTKPYAPGALLAFVEDRAGCWATAAELPAKAADPAVYHPANNV